MADNSSLKRVEQAATEAALDFAEKAVAASGEERHLFLRSAERLASMAGEVLSLYDGVDETADAEEPVAYEKPAGDEDPQESGTDAPEPPEAEEPETTEDEPAADPEPKESGVPECVANLREMLVDPEDPAAGLTDEQEIEAFKSRLVKNLTQTYALDDDRATELADSFKESGLSVMKDARKRNEKRAEEKAAKEKAREEADTDMDEFDDIFNEAWEDV